MPKIDQLASIETLCAEIAVIEDDVSGISTAIGAVEKAKTFLSVRTRHVKSQRFDEHLYGYHCGGSKFIQEQGIKGKSTQDYVDHLMKQAKGKGIPINKANVETYARRGCEIID